MAVSLLALVAIGVAVGLVHAPADRSRRPSPLGDSLEPRMAEHREQAPTFVEVAAAPSAWASPVPERDEASFMSQLRMVARRDSAAAIDLVREGNTRFGDSAGAPERASLLVHALANLGRASEARAEAEEVVNELPDSPWIREIEEFTGAHRHRDVRLGPDGGIEFY